MRSILAMLLLCSLSIGAEPIKVKPAKRPARTQVVLMVLQSQEKAANAAAVKVLGPHGKGTFSVPYKLGSRTYLIAACQLTDEQEAALRVELAKIRGTNPQMLRQGKEFSGRAKAELKRRKLTPKKSTAAVKSR